MAGAAGGVGGGVAPFGAGFALSASARALASASASALDLAFALASASARARASASASARVSAARSCSRRLSWSACTALRSSATFVRSAVSEATVPSSSRMASTRSPPRAAVAAAFRLPSALGKPAGPSICSRTLSSSAADARAIRRASTSTASRARRSWLVRVERTSPSTRSISRAEAAVASLTSRRSPSASFSRDRALPSSLAMACSAFFCASGSGSIPFRTGNRAANPTTTITAPPRRTHLVRLGRGRGLWTRTSTAGRRGGGAAGVGRGAAGGAFASATLTTSRS